MRDAAHSHTHAHTRSTTYTHSNCVCEYILSPPAAAPCHCQPACVGDWATCGLGFPPPPPPPSRLAPSRLTQPWISTLLSCVRAFCLWPPQNKTLCGAPSPYSGPPNSHFYGHHALLLLLLLHGPALARQCHRLATELTPASARPCSPRPDVRN